MNGFYFIKDKNDNSNVINLITQVNEFPNCLELSIDMQRGLHIFIDAESFLVQKNNSILFVIGCFIFGGKWGKAALEWLADKLAEGMDLKSLLLLNDTHGQFCLVINNNQNVFIVTDPLASFPIYYYEDDHTIQVSNLLFPMAQLNSVHLDLQSLTEYLSFSYCINKTFFKEIHLFDRGMVYSLNNYIESIRYKDFIKNLNYGRVKSAAQAANEIIESIQSSMAFLKGQNTVFADITGGFDTRTNVAILHSMGISFEGGICGEQVLGEEFLAAQVAKTLGVNFHSNITLRNQDNFQKILELHKYITGGIPIPYHSTELLYYYQYIRRYFDVHITGFAGSQLMDIFLPKLNLFSKRLKPKNLILKRMNFLDIYRSGIYKETEYNEKLVTILQSLAEEFGTDLHDQFAPFVDLTTFNRFYHGTLLGTHNIIMPQYCPFLESSLIRISLETPLHLKKDRAIQRIILAKISDSLSRVMTSHGYNYNVNSIYKIKDRIKNIVRMTAYSFPTLSGTIRKFRKSANKHKAELAVLQRAFWLDLVDHKWNSDWSIFKIVDRNFVEKFAKTEKGGYALKAKIAYLGEIIEKCNVKL